MPSTRQQRRRFGTPPLPFNPRMFGATFWLRADDVVGGDGASVATWSDRIAGLALTQGTGAAQPTFRANGGSNNTPSIQFDGGDVVKNTSVLGSLLFATNQCHIFIVLKQDSTQAQNCAFNFFQATANQVDILPTFSDTIFFDFGDKVAAGGNGRISVAQPSGWDNSWRLTQYTRDTATNQTIRDQGVQLVTATRSKTLDITQTFALRVGSEETEVTFFKGHIAEVIVCNVVQSDAARAQFERYFNQRYRLF